MAMKLQVVSDILGIILKGCRVLNPHAALVQHRGNGVSLQEENTNKYQSLKWRTIHLWNGNDHREWRGRWVVKGGYWPGLLTYPQYLSHIWLSINFQKYIKLMPSYCHQFNYLHSSIQSEPETNSAPQPTKTMQHVFLGQTCFPQWSP